MADVAKGTVLLTPKFDNLTATIKSELDDALGSVDGSSYGSKAASGFSTGFAAVTGTVMALVSKAVDAAATAIANSLDSAISRVDTLNNFPIVMQNLGYSAEEAEAAISKMSASLDGLPTALDDIVSMTQSLAPFCSSLDEATELALAMSNAVLASGNSSSEASRALQQYSQMLSKGKVDAAGWYTLQETMGVALNQVAEAMLGAGASSSDLYDALSDGIVTMEEFNACVIEMNQGGIEGFVSFEQQARDATNGIGTALENVQNRISKALATIIEAIGAEDIADAINSFSSQFAPLAEKVAGYIEAAKPYVSDFVMFLKENAETVKSVVATIAAAFAALGVASGVDTLTSKVSSLAKSFGSLLSPANLVVAALAALAAGFVYLYQTNDEFAAAVDGLVSSLGSALAPVLDTIMESLQSLAEAVLPPIQSLLDALAPVLVQIVDVLGQVLSVLAELFESCLSTVLPVVTDILATVVEVAAQIAEAVLPVIQTLFETVWPAVQSAVETAMSVIGTVVETVMGVIQGVIETVMAVVEGDWEGAWESIKGIGETVWNGLCSVADTLFGDIADTVSGVLDDIKQWWSDAWDNVKEKASDAWENIKQGVSDGVENVLDWFRNLPQNIVDALGDLGSLLFESGKSILNGLWDGLKSVWESITGWISGLGETIFNLKGPLPYDRKLLVPAGLAIMGGLRDSLAEGFSEVESDMESYTASMAATEMAASYAGVSAAAPYAGAGGGDVYNVYLDGSLLSADDRIAEALESLMDGVRRAKRMGV